MKGRLLNKIYIPKEWVSWGHSGILSARDFRVVFVLISSPLSLNFLHLLLPLAKDLSSLKWSVAWTSSVLESTPGRVLEATKLLKVEFWMTSVLQTTLGRVLEAKRLPKRVLEAKRLPRREFWRSKDYPRESSQGQKITQKRVWLFLTR